MSRTGWSRGQLVPVAATILVAAAIALGTSRGQGGSSPVPSADNPGPRGLKALRLYLEEGGAEVGLQQDGFEALGSGDATLLVPAPLASAPTVAERTALRAWVEGGGTVILLQSPGDPRGRELAAQLGVRLGNEERGFRAAKEELQTALENFTGTGRSAGVALSPWLPGPIQDFAPEVRSRYPAAVRLEGAAPVVGIRELPYVVIGSLGAGRVVAVARPDPFENFWLAEGDDLGLALALLQGGRPGRILFDERHLHVGEAPALPAGVGAALLQLCAAAALLGLARGRRLGGARPTVSAPGRSSLEYVEQLGLLYERARVEQELTAELIPALRRTLHDRLGVSPLLDDAGVDELLAARGIAAGRFRALSAAARAALAAGARPAELAALTREVAELERELAEGNRGG